MYNLIDIGEMSDYIHNYHPLVIVEKGKVWVSWKWQRAIIESEKRMSFDELIGALESVTHPNRPYKSLHQHRHQWAKEYYFFRLQERYNEKKKELATLGG